VRVLKASYICPSTNPQQLWHSQSFFLTALIPLFIGFIWYNNKVFGKAWMNSAGLTEEQFKGGNMLKIFGLTYLFSVMASLALSTMVIHQFGFFSILANEPGAKDPATEVGKMAAAFMVLSPQSFLCSR
jgi:hypothetical protein